ncbi:urease accessory protein UreD [Dietzia sp. PP-33]|jgi:urease accessory protein UreH|uniref:urease accessory protein UreD n=1 Tax=Dietzia sp. PP-33 TaxID=2957500 RepID=UPI0029B630C2|nr:urease accessory protein UreD [Dietzia sp. PP-33]MDX2357796.1 urease accessory protein UreD [Dietzia sp. PP-33]
MASLVVQSATSGLITGEHLRQRIVVRDGGRVRVVGQGAMPVQKAQSQQGSAEDLQLNVVSGSRLEFFAEPRLLFPGSEFSQVTKVALDCSSDMVLVDAVVRHPEPGAVSYSSEIRLEFDGTVVAVERMGFASVPEDRFGATALILAVGGFVAGLDWKPWLEKHSTPTSYGAVSPLRECTGASVRIVADDGRHLRAAIDDALAILS